MPAIASLVAIACVSGIGATNAAAGMDSVGILVGLEKAATPAAMERLARAAVDAGIRWTRQSFEWRALETAPATYDWAPADRAVATAERFGLLVLGLITTSPLGHAPAAPEELDRFAHFVRSLVGRYGDRVGHWEIWNEPNLRMFWGPRPDPRAYAAALATGYRAAKEANPGCQIVGMSTLGSDTTFIRRACEAGAAGSFDVLSVHPYRDLRDMDLNNDRPDVTMRRDVAVLRALLAEFGRDAPIWFTEMGRNTSLAPEGEGVSWAGQADYTVKMHVMALATGVDKLFQYELYAPATLPTNKEYYYGILHPDFSPKPAYHALRTMTSRLAGLRYNGAALAEDSCARAYLFDGGGRAVIVAWGVKGSARVSLPVGSAGVRITDGEGRERAVAMPEGTLVLALTPSPVYVQDFDRETVLRSCALSLALPWEQSPAGEWSEVECRVTNPAPAPIRWSLEAALRSGGQVHLEPREGTLASRESQPVRLRIRPDEPGRLGGVVPLDATLRAGADSGPPWAVTKTLHVPIDPGWLICGPFPNPGPDDSRPPGAAPTDTGLFIDHFAAAGGEAAVEPTEGQSHSGALGAGATATWRRHRLDQRGFIDFRHAFDVRRNATAYAYRTLVSDADRRVVIHLGSDDGIRVWLNHREAFCKHVHREAHVVQDEVVVSLRKGANPCLIKVDQGGWGWGAYVEIVDEGN